MEAASLTGHMKSLEFSALCMPTDSFLSSFFWNMKVRSTKSAEARKKIVWGSNYLFLKKRILPSVKVLVRLFSSAPVLEYSQDRIQKKKARQASSARASWGAFLISLARLYILCRTDTGIAFCCLVGGSRFL